MRDLPTPMAAEKSSVLAPPHKPAEGPFPLETLRHSMAHLMASAVGHLFPGTKYAIGPPIEDGFYYDFELPRPLTEEDLPKIEEEMRRIAKEGGKFVCTEASKEQARARLKGQPYKLEIVEEIPAGAPITFYSHGSWTDLCEGPHVDDASRLVHFKLLSVAGAYWRGDEKKPQLQRIYGTAWWSKEDLDAHLARLAEIEKRDHRRLGRELDLFTTHLEAGPGLVFWHPNLAIVRRSIEEWWGGELARHGYLPVYTPHIASEELFKRSGHLENYADLMYAPMAIDERPYRVKPMNCPGHILVYASRGRSYRELPLRLSEMGTVYRYERSGVLHGMLRVRGFTQDDSHIFCTPGQLEGEIAGVLELVDLVMKTFGYSFTAFLATRPKEKSIGAPESWEHAIAALRAGACRTGLPLEMDEGGGAFYGPKIDFKLRDALGREWQGSTVQVDFNLPERFDLEYTAAEGGRKRPVMVHRAIFGSLERFVGGLVEHFGGRFPFWCAPVQVGLLPITDAQVPYAGEIASRMLGDLFRVKSFDGAGNLNKRIREAQLEKIPYMAVIGKREVEAKSVSLRLRTGEDRGAVPLEAFLALCREKRASRSLDL
ncbi:MAG: threonine--tRNA ligase [Planctomycetes bacterium]|nr:threonine--tRNA ligase [Planctomycetota bacterium]